MFGFLTKPLAKLTVPCQFPSVGGVTDKNQCMAVGLKKLLENGKIVGAV
jgi:hypothetical protein